MNKKLHISLILMLFGVLFAKGQETIAVVDSDSREAVSCANTNKSISDIEVHFRLAESKLDPDYLDNAESLSRFETVIDSIGIDNLDSIAIVSLSSPEGSYKYNIKLSEQRARTMRDYVVKNYPRLADRLHVHAGGESWDLLREYVKNDTKLSAAEIKKVLSVIDADVNIDTKKWRMQRLSSYNYLLTTYYPLIRNSACFIIYYYRVANEVRAKVVPVTLSPVVPELEFSPTLTVAPQQVDTVPVGGMERWTRHLHVKTNAIGWAMGITNAAVEVDLAPHWSFTLPIYYSGWNYFKSTIKFRVVTAQPEFRYWFKRGNDGLFVGAHFGFGYYNFATDGGYRYQDHNRETPSLGGGLSVGYRMPLDPAKRWRVEFTLGAGVYASHFDKFRNTPDVKDGLLVNDVKKTWVGIDQAAVTFSYTFDLQKCFIKK